MDIPNKKKDMEDQPANMTEDEGMAGGMSEATEDATDESTVDDLDETEDAK